MSRPDRLFSQIMEPAISPTTQAKADAAKAYIEHKYLKRKEEEEKKRAK